MILRTNHGGLVLLFIACFSWIAHTEVIDDDGSDMPQRFKRDYQDDPKDYLDKVIEHWIYKIPVLIDIAVAESDLQLRISFHLWNRFWIPTFTRVTRPGKKLRQT